jgi:DNA-binding MarR family transcriptional regulator
VRGEVSGLKRKTGLKKSINGGRPSRVRLNLNERTAYRFLHLAGQVMRCLGEMYGPRYGLTIGTWKVLSMIGAYGPMSASELGKRTSLEPDKVTRTVDNLVKRSLVLRRQDPADRRRVILTLSSKGTVVNDAIEHVRCCI